MKLNNIKQEDITNKAKSLYIREDFLAWLEETLPEGIKAVKLYNRFGKEVQKVPHADFWLVDLIDVHAWSEGFTLDYNAIKRFYKKGMK